MCDLVACVTADRETRISRIINRDKITREAAQRRLSAQHSDSFYTSQSDFVVNGTGDMEYLSSMALMIKRKALSLKAAIDIAVTKRTRRGVSCSVLVGAFCILIIFVVLG